jgi:DNA-binding transcriptional ArsR family regulator
MFFLFTILHSISYFTHFKKTYDMRKQKNETVVLKKGKKDIELDYAELRKAVLVLRAVNHKLRQQIIDLLEENEKMTVTDLYIKLRLEQSVASQHLAILRRAGVVATERNGKFIYYCVDKERINHISRLVEELTEYNGN